MATVILILNNQKSRMAKERKKMDTISDTVVMERKMAEGCEVRCLKC